MHTSHRSVVIATCSDYPDLDGDSALLLPALESIGVHAHCHVWDDPTVDWGAFTLCLVRSTWDYAARRDSFVRWAERVAGVSTLWNPAGIVRWNTDKDYLREIDCWGFHTIPTLWLEAGGRLRVEEAMATLDSAELVIKPRISASGIDTFRVSAALLEEGQAFLDRLLSERDVMVQPYFSSVETVGEMSLIFLGGVFSHAVRKVPCHGEFRSQEEWGSTITAAIPRADELDFSCRLLDRLGPSLLYGRVDLMRDPSDRPCLTELELTEPSLYLGYGEGAALRLAELVRDRVSAITYHRVSGRRDPTEAVGLSEM